MIAIKKAKNIVLLSFFLLSCFSFIAYCFFFDFVSSIVERFRYDFATNSMEQKFFKFEDGEFDCSRVPLPQKFGIENGMSKEVVDIISHRNNLEKYNYRSIKGLCELQCEKKLLPHKLEDNTVRITGITTPLYEGPHATIEEVLSECEIKVELVEEMEDAHIIIRGSEFYSRIVGKKWSGEKLVFFESLEAIFTKELSDPQDFIQRINSVSGFVHFNPISTEILVYRNHKFNEKYYNLTDFPTMDKYGDDYEKVLLQNIETKNKEYIAASFISSCRDDRNDKKYLRSRYIEELDKHMKVASFGKCGANHFQQDRLYGSYVNQMSHSFLCKLNHLPDYKFGLCFENSIRYGYASEKLFECLNAIFTVPVYYGAPNIYVYFDEEVIRKYKIFIFANDFPNPVDLANYLNYLDRNTTAYLEYFQWRIDGVDLKPSEYVRKKPIRFPKDAPKEELRDHLYCRIARVYRDGKKLCKE